MRPQFPAFVAVLMLLSACAPAAAPAPSAAGIETVCFTPGGDCTGVIVAEIDHARASVLVQAYDFTSRPITEALVRAKRRGVDVRVILDKSTVCWTKGAPKADCGKADADEAAALVEAGIPVLIDAKHKIAHNKVMVLDAAKVITGSFNFTVSAQTANAENLVVLVDAKTAAAYAANWATHAAHSVPLER